MYLVVPHRSYPFRRLKVSGNLRGEVTVYDVVHQEQMYKWSAHKRYAITCVKFTHDATAVYSCAEDCKVRGLAAALLPLPTTTHLLTVLMTPLPRLP